ncbi:tRNA 2-selenouridine synthase [Paenibacillus cellulosilyticus]|uniref:tRNA 2-selenouridine synthase n=1 Tax=Paenibacillus cellulosilyticus TaxID=375489 RepID=A0A2V2YV58_9BACL|nr:tRNA 2-selenouridine(34) synthase MnmH [Paenibacillus cellulosilyticus]PWW04739.1 tRNA 2-selenouridine synthase [Paenibacillus cellulosilyticus]QKS45864.1 tRNA 2-selenouridine(34) synthase MnmH [Paenibacillus cellulosilyticus]
MFQDITIEQLRAQRDSKELVTIDVRSPSEFRESTIPGSINIPLFDDQERAEIGTLYKQTSIQAAKERGLEVVSAKLPAFIREIDQIKEKKAVFCWRGGMRSKTTATVLSLMGIHVYRLNGGFRSYRKWVVETLASFEMNPQAVVLHGNTGTGKTAILKQLESEGYPVLDLERLAGHRGSIFGEVGLKPNNQKTFEALLLEKLITLQNSPYVVLEAESKRIGRVVLPDFLMQKKATGKSILIEAPVESRVQRILEDYPTDQKDVYLKAFNGIKSRIHTPIAAEIASCLENERYEPAIRMLLEYYYDPRYNYTTEQYEEAPQITLSVKGLDDAVEQVRAILD